MLLRIMLFNDALTNDNLKCEIFTGPTTKGGIKYWADIIIEEFERSFLIDLDTLNELLEVKPGESKSVGTYGLKKVYRSDDVVIADCLDTCIALKHKEWKEIRDLLITVSKPQMDLVSQRKLAGQCPICGYEGKFMPPACLVCPDHGCYAGC
jgi:hypothetical protein